MGDWATGPLPYSPLLRVSLGLASGCQSQNVIADAAGPDTFTFEELLRLLASAVTARVRMVHTPISLGFALTRLVGLLLRDVVLTRDEVDSLMTSDGVAIGTTGLGDWLSQNAGILGLRYVSEPRRNWLVSDPFCRDPAIATLLQSTNPGDELAYDLWRKARLMPPTAP